MNIIVNILFGFANLKWICDSKLKIYSKLREEQWYWKSYKKKAKKGLSIHEMITVHIIMVPTSLKVLTN